jgi:hypothetical protein
MEVELHWESHEVWRPTGARRPATAPSSTSDREQFGGTVAPAITTLNRGRQGLLHEAAEGVVRHDELNAPILSVSVHRFEDGFDVRCGHGLGSSPLDLRAKRVCIEPLAFGHVVGRQRHRDNRERRAGEGARALGSMKAAAARIRSRLEDGPHRRPGKRVMIAPSVSLTAVGRWAVGEVVQRARTAQCPRQHARPPGTAIRHGPS